MQPVLGYFVFALALFLPGLGLGELLGIFKKGETLGVRVAMAFGLGMALDTVLLFLKTSGLSIMGVTLLGIDLNTVYLILWLGVIALIISVIVKRKFTFPVRPVKSDYFLAGIVALLVVVIAIYYVHSPIFPASDSGDFHDHVFETRDLISGTISYQRGQTGGPTGLEEYLYPPHGVLYIAVHYQLALAFLLVSGPDLITSQIAMSIIIVLATLLFFLTAQKLFNSVNAGLVVALIYAVTGMVWSNAYFASGLEANFYGFIATLFFIVGLVIYFRDPKAPSSWIVLLIATVNLLMSHYSSLTILPAVVLFCIVELVRKRSKASLLSYGIPAVVLVGSVAGLLAVFPSFFPLLYQMVAIEGAGAFFFGSTYLSNLLAAFPYLSYTAALTGDVPFVALLILTGSAIYFAIKKAQIYLLIPLVWFLSNFFVLPGNPNVWRFALEGLVPLTIVAGYGAFSLLQRFGKAAPKNSSTTGPYALWKVALILVITITALFIGSYGQVLLSYSLQSPSAAAQQQKYVYDAIIWLGGNTANDSSYYATNDWRFTYADVLIAHDVDFGNTSSPSVAISQALSNADQYIIVCQPIVGNPTPPSENPWLTFPNASTSQLTLVYTNPDVRIFSINAF